MDDALLDSSESSKKGDVALSSDDFAAGVVPQCLRRQVGLTSSLPAFIHGVAGLQRISDILEDFSASCEQT